MGGLAGHDCDTHPLPIPPLPSPAYPFLNTFNTTHIRTHAHLALQIYDEEAHTYRPMEEVVDEIEADLQQLAAAAQQAQQQLAAQDQEARAQQVEGREEGSGGGVPAVA